MLPPLADVVLIFEHRVDQRDRLAAHLRADSRLTSVTIGPHGWLLGRRTFPGSAHVTGLPDDLVFAEGADLFARPGGSPGQLLILQERLRSARAQLDDVAGDFGLVRIGGEGTVDVVRSCAGQVPFFIDASGSRVVVTTRSDLMATYMSASPRPDELVTAMWGSRIIILPNRRSFIAGVESVPRGTVTSVFRDGTSESVVYWEPLHDIDADIGIRRATEHAEALRRELLHRLDADLSGIGDAVALSGGVDSASLIALTARLNRQPQAFTLMPNDPAVRERELGFIAPLLRGLQLPPVIEVTVDQADLVPLLESAPPVVAQVPHPVLCALPQFLEAAPIQTLVGGDFADDVCGGPPTLADWLAAAQGHRLPRLIRRLPNGPTDILRWVKNRARRIGDRWVPFPVALDGAFRPDLQEEYRTWRHAMAVALPGPSHPRNYFAAMDRWDGWRVMNWEASSSVGVRRSFPFATRAVIELAYECHPSELVGPGPKRLLRAALHDDVPHANLYRNDKNYWAAAGGHAPTRQVDVPDDVAALFTNAAGRTMASPRRAARITTMARSTEALAKIARMA